MTEERWHNFAKEKPSEDMEGRNFIVSNGHYEKIATWCGYWENEPFMGDRLCDEVVRWKFYFTPEEEKANDETRTEPKAMKCDELKAETIVPQGCTITLQMYPKAEADAAIAELKARIQLDDDEMAGFLQLEEECGGGDLRNMALASVPNVLKVMKIIQHQKRKRCLAMVKLCKDNADWWDYEQRNRLEEQRGNAESLRFKEAHAKFCHYVKWEKCWMEIAKEPTWAKFLQLIRKEAK